MDWSQLKDLKELGVATLLVAWFLWESTKDKAAKREQEKQHAAKIERMEHERREDQEELLGILVQHKKVIEANRLYRLRQRPKRRRK